MMKLKMLLAAAALLATPALAQDEASYLDDRSTPEAVISSYYNAIDRHEYARAWSYYQDGEGAPAFDAFAKGYETTASVAVSFGQAAQEGAAGSTYYEQPVYLDVTNTDGSHAKFGGCYTLRLVQPANQVEPPFRPLHIVSGKLKRDRGEANFAAARCEP